MEGARNYQLMGGMPDLPGSMGFSGRHSPHIYPIVPTLWPIAATRTSQNTKLAGSVHMFRTPKEAQNPPFRLILPNQDCSGVWQTVER